MSKKKLLWPSSYSESDGDSRYFVNFDKINESNDYPEISDEIFHWYDTIHCL